MTQRLEDVQGLLGGLVTQHIRRRELAYYDWSRLVNQPLPIDRCIPPAHCWRSVSKRTLSAPVTFLSNTLFAFFGVGSAPFYGYTGGGAGTLSPPASAFNAPALANAFWDNNVNTSQERGRVDGLVLIGLRARVTLALWFRRVPAPAPPAIGQWRANSTTAALRRYLADYTTLRIRPRADDGDPWIEDIPLSYLERPDGRFVAVPPLLWTGRSAVATLQGRAADFGARAGGIPDVRSGVADLFSNTQAELLIEGLWIQPPDKCGTEWPGAYCPVEVIGNHPQYDPDFCRR